MVGRILNAEFTIPRFGGATCASAVPTHNHHMAVPWLRLLDTALGLASLARNRRDAAAGNPVQQIEAGSRALGGLETRLAGVVVAALKEAFDRDTRRLELEREQLEAERQRAE